MSENKLICAVCVYVCVVMLATARQWRLYEPCHVQQLCQTDPHLISPSIPLLSLSSFPSLPLPVSQGLAFII